MLSNFPPLQFRKKNRPREYNQYSDVQRAEIIYLYLFEGVATRRLDEQVLGLEGSENVGHQSHSVLRHCGISGNSQRGHKGKLKGLPLRKVINEMKKNHRYFLKIVYHLEVYQMIIGANTYNDPPYIVKEGYSDYGPSSSSVTESEYLTVQRIGQENFKEALVTRYASCLLCELEQRPLLIASHIKPWKDASDWERLDQWNGFILCPNHDKVFDQGFITFEDSGTISISNTLEKKTADLLNLETNIKIPIEDGHVKYLKWHQQNVFQQ